MKLSSVASLFVLGLVLVGLSGCQSAPKVNSEFDSSADFTSARTFALRPLPNSIPGVDPGLVLRVGPAATSAARASMSAKGFTEASDVAKADLAVLIHGKSVPKTDVTEWGFTPYYAAGWRGSYAYGMYGGSSVTVDQYDEGTLIVEVYDVKTRKMIWVGWMTARSSGRTEDQAAKVGNAVSEILAGFPGVGTRPVAPARK